MAVEGSDPGALRHVATGLRAAATTMAGISTTYMAMATHQNLKTISADCVAGPDAAQVSPSVKRARELAADWTKKAQQYAAQANSLFQLAAAADTKAAKQDAASAASGFTAPNLTLPDPPGPVTLPTGGGRDGVASSNLPGPYGDGGAPAAVRGLVDPGGPTPGGLGLDSAQPGLVVDAGPEAVVGADPGPDAAGDGPLALARRLGVGPGLAAAGAVGAGIAASVLIANRRRAQRETERENDEESDADVVEAVYQTGPGQRPASG